MVTWELMMDDCRGEALIEEAAPSLVVLDVLLLWLTLEVVVAVVVVEEEMENRTVDIVVVIT